MRLPIMYNANYHILELSGGVTVGGDDPAVVHFAYGKSKPFNITPESPEWRYASHVKGLRHNAYGLKGLPSKVLQGQIRLLLGIIL